MTREELQKLYGEAVFQTKVWTARAASYEQQLVELMNKVTKEPEKKDGSSQS